MSPGREGGGRGGLSHLGDGPAVPPHLAEGVYYSGGQLRPPPPEAGHLPLCHHLVQQLTAADGVAILVLEVRLGGGQRLLWGRGVWTG